MSAAATTTTTIIPEDDEEFAYAIQLSLSVHIRHISNISFHFILFFL